MSERYIDNTKRPKPQDTQIGILKVYAFYQKIQQRGSDPGQSTDGVTYLSIKIHPKSCIFPLKVATTLLNGLRKGAVGA